MTTVNITAALSGVTAHYVFTPQAIEDITSDTGITAPDIIRGWANPEASNSGGIPQSINVALDNAYTWDVDISFRNAPPIVFSGFSPGDGGDLLTLLAEQGWQPL